MQLRANKPAVPVGEQPVLIVDVAPDARRRQALAEILKRWGYRVMIAADSGSAIKLCEKVRPCLVVLGDTNDDPVDPSTLLHELADILYEEPPPVALMIHNPHQSQGPNAVTLSPLLVLEELLDGADESFAA